MHNNLPGTATALLLLAACTPTTHPAPPTPSTNPPPPTLSHYGHDNFPDHNDSPDPTPPPVDTARAVAAGFAAAWITGTTNPVGWWHTVQPWCDPHLAAALPTTDPANVPAHTITGPPVQLPGNAAEGLRYHIPTDTGTLTVTLGVIDGTWRVTDVDFQRTPR